MIVDLHAHTMPISDDSYLSPEVLIDRSREAGFDGVCFTEHNWHWSEKDIERLSLIYDFPVFHGIEISSDEGHLLVFGLKEYRYDMHRIEYIRDVVDEVGGAIILAHPYRWRIHYSTDPQRMLEMVCKDRVCSLVDGMEVLNGRSEDMENEFALELCNRLGLCGVGGSDAHAIEDINTCATIFERPIGNTRELITELKAGRVRPVDLRNGRRSRKTKRPM